MKKPIKVVVISLMYLFGGSLLFILVILIISLNFLNPNALLNIVNTILPSGGFYAGDTVITATQVYLAILFLQPMFLITSILSFLAGYLFLTTEKKLAWYLTFAASILYCMVLIGLIVDWIILQDNVREIYQS